MKKFIAVLVFSVGILFLQNCSTKNLVSENINRRWMLVEFQDFPKEMMVKSGANMDMSPTKTNRDQYRASMGCNKMFFTAKFNSNGTVEFSNIGSTMMFCDKNMDLETAFGNSLPSMTKYKIEGHYLTLSNDKGQRMRFVAADWD